MSSCFQYRLGFQAKRGNRLAKILRFFAFHSLTKNAKLTTIIFAKFCIVFTFIRLIHLRKKIRIFTKTVCEIRTKVFVRWNPSNTDQTKLVCSSSLNQLNSLYFEILVLGRERKRRNMSEGLCKKVSFSFSNLRKFNN